MSLYKRGDVWWYDFEIDGVRIRESARLKSRKIAAEIEARRKAELVEHGPEAAHRQDAPAFANFAHDEFRAWSENQHRGHPSTHERYMRSIKVLVEFFGQRTLDMISSADVERFKIVRSRQRRKYARDGRTVTPAAVNRDLAVLRILFNLATRLRKAKTNPVVGVKLLPERNLRMRVISWEEQSAYLAAASQPLRDVAALILETGMRPGEVVSIHKEDVNLQMDFLRIPEGKTAFARRTIPLTSRAQAILVRRITASIGNWLFPSRNDPARPTHWLRRTHLTTLGKARITPPFRLYDLRHTALTRMAMAGVDLSTLRELAGHANIQMTMRYVHPTPEHKRKAIEKLEAFCADRVEEVYSSMR